MLLERHEGPPGAVDPRGRTDAAPAAGFRPGATPARPEVFAGWRAGAAIPRLPGRGESVGRKKRNLESRIYNRRLEG